MLRVSCQNKEGYARSNKCHPSFPVDTGKSRQRAKGLGSEDPSRTGELILLVCILGESTFNPSGQSTGTRGWARPSRSLLPPVSPRRGVVTTLTKAVAPRPRLLFSRQSSPLTVHGSHVLLGRLAVEESGVIRTCLRRGYWYLSLPLFLLLCFYEVKTPPRIFFLITEPASTSGSIS